MNNQCRKCGVLYDSGGEASHTCFKMSEQKLWSDRSALEDAYDSLASQLADYKEQLRWSLTKEEQLKEQLFKTVEERDDANAKIEELINEIDDDRRAMLLITKERDAANAEVSQLRSHVALLTTQCADLDAAKASLEAEVARLKDNLESILNPLPDEDTVRFINQLEALETELRIEKQINAEMSKYKEERDQLADKLRRIELANTEMTRNDHVHFGKLMEERDQALAEVERCKHIANDRNDTVNALNMNITELRDWCAKLEAALNDVIHERYSDDPCAAEYADQDPIVKICDEYRAWKDGK